MEPGEEGSAFPPRLGRGFAAGQPDFVAVTAPFALSGVEGSGVEGLGQPGFVAATAPFALSRAAGLGQPDVDAATAPFALSGVEG